MAANVSTLPDTDLQLQQNDADILPSFGTNSAGRIGRYQIIKTLGEGSFGKVKCIYHMFRSSSRLFININ